MIVKASEFDFNIIRKTPIQKRKRGNQGSHARHAYKNIITAFDIETTRLPEIEQSIMYIWQWQIGLDVTVIGRTWKEFKDFVNGLTEALSGREKLVVYVHNLSYEFQFLSGIYDFGSSEVFALDKRKVLKCEMNNRIEFRCSYIHTNMSLSTFLDKMNVTCKKLAYDYSIRRYPWTELTESEIEYCVNDVKGLVQALIVEMSHDNDNLYTIPLTSTGYVRRDAKKAMRSISKQYIKEQQPDYELYTALREAFRGGNTHANRYYAGVILENVKSADRSSSYPDTLCNCKYPIGRFIKTDKEVGLEELKDLIVRREKAVVCRISLVNVRLANEFWGCPYLAKDKCRNVKNCQCDNGRILEAEYLETTMTDVDLEILLDEYVFDDIIIIELWHARYGMLPKPIIETNIDYYVKKTELKDVDGQELLYMKSKNKLNSIYGMMAQDPVKQDIIYEENIFSEAEEEESILLYTYQNKAFLCYQWGVWCTAWARWMLEQGIKLAGDGFVYCDTDSVKYLGDVNFSKFNEWRIELSKKSGTYATDKKGTVYYMGVFEQEQTYTEFITLGAKKYAYKYKDGTLHITIAGVNKKKGAVELERSGGLKAFKQGFTFVDGGGTESVYNDDIFGWYEVEGRKIYITKNVVIRDSTYRLGITEEYENLLLKCSLFG